MKTTDKNAKASFGTAKFAKVKNVRYLSWEDALDVEFEDGRCILEPHATIRRANKISPKARCKASCMRNTKALSACFCVEGLARPCTASALRNPATSPPVAA